ncbi:MAG: hypothetical protein OXF33_12405 [Rhodospirillales bacterium]|nr:hypothetical protein [Rhodospirillales bacterium]
MSAILDTIEEATPFFGGFLSGRVIAQPIPPVRSMQVNTARRNLRKFI